ncbi:DUF11 domain-containing protein [Ramlibacter sp. XY19]|uniref:DUF11 domain-containing protein n=1 Tax=Ramlibacter paludis TaxID=2908000 RepID=UPI0023DCA5E6|nr:DUF11 domain-containing protein [Ramlibacter paludis]MCG2595276.1 DUF11 domain-containing protein [Ramlibacter paludis]
MATALAALWAPLAWAAGTGAGTVIGNTATLTYTAEGRPGSATAVSLPIVVARVVNVAVTWQDGAAVPATSPDSSKPLAFVVSNTGNGTETFALSRDNVQGGDQFDPASATDGAIWLESGAQPGLQRTGPNADILYAPGANDIVLAADASRQVYVSSQIPAGIATGSFGKVGFTATATTPGASTAAPGTALGTFGGVQVVAGIGNGRASASGSYLVAGASMGLAKSVVNVRDPRGGTRVMPGSVVTYRLVITLTGTGTVDNVAVNDPLPAQVTYVPGSITVDTAVRTDAADGDEASFANGAVQASFGTLAVPATRVIEFKATVN